MEKSNKKGISLFTMLGIIIIIVVIVIVVLNLNGNKKASEETDNATLNQTENVETNNKGEKVNTSSNLKAPRDVNGLYVDQIELKFVSGRTTFTANITNRTSTTTKGQLYNIVFVDKDGNQEGSMGLYIRAIEPNKTISIEASIDKDVTECYNFNLQLK